MGTIHLGPFVQVTKRKGRRVSLNALSSQQKQSTATVRAMSILTGPGSEILHTPVFLVKKK
jgi:hypothetical protein